MTTIADRGIAAARSLETVSPPAWVGALVPGVLEARGAGARTVEGESHALVSATIVGADALGALDLQRAVCDVYVDILKAMRGLKASEPIRLWNFIPGIHARMGDGDGGFLDRYMVFNAGRFAGYSEWYGDGDVGPRTATATGIGHLGPDLVVHCLTGTTAGEAVENPRQVPAYRYSKRRGPMPPCFARATRVEMGGRPMLLVGGTASVRGENSVNLGDVRAQALETFHNMACLVGGDAVRGSDEATIRRALARYRTLRVYCVHAADLERVRELVQGFFGDVEVEYRRADVCRRTLLVEIEGTAELVTKESAAVGGV